MLPPTDFNKTTALAAEFLSLSGGKMNYMKLLKLMYLAERRALIDKGYLVTKDRPYSMRHGPVLTNSLDLLKETTFESNEYWNSHIKKAGYNSVLISHPEDDELNTFEKKIVKELYREHKDKSKYQLRDWLHENCPEWKKTSSSIPIDYEDILRTKFDESTARKILADINNAYLLESFV